MQVRPLPPPDTPQILVESWSDPGSTPGFEPFDTAARRESGAIFVSQLYRMDAEIRSALRLRAARTNLIHGSAEAANPGYTILVPAGSARQLRSQVCRLPQSSGT
jgi:hypothetical protein